MIYKKDFLVKKVFKVNEFITLKLQWNKRKGEFETMIFVGEEPFRQCKYLLLVNPNEIIGDYVESIDYAAEKMVKVLEKDIKPEEMGISPDQEFIAHCSNIHAWVENDYDTRLLHSNLAFPLLRKLSI